MKPSIAGGIAEALKSRTAADEEVLAVLTDKKIAEAVCRPEPATDELLIELTGPTGQASVTLRPFEVSRLRGRYGRGPKFEEWVIARMRDMMISFGGG
jgi:hypothetical protein